MLKTSITNTKRFTIHSCDETPANKSTVTNALVFAYCYDAKVAKYKVHIVESFVSYYRIGILTEHK